MREEAAGRTPKRGLAGGRGRESKVGRVEGKEAGTGFLPSFLRFRPDVSKENLEVAAGLELVRGGAARVVEKQKSHLGAGSKPALRGMSPGGQEN